jgi:hypothetical protein
MAKISHRQSDKHDKAMQLIMGSDKPLTFEEREFCYTHFNPMATHDVGRNGIFFTPLDIAWEFSIYVIGGKRYIDLCAGIGKLAWTTWQRGHIGGGGGIKEIVCLELVYDFVQAGQRLFPEGTWIHGDVFDQSLIQSLGFFDVAISNPPFSNISAKQESGWLSYQGAAHFMVAEIAMRIASSNEFIIPYGDMDYDFRDRGRGKQSSKERKRFGKVWPEVTVNPEANDLDLMEADWQGANPSVAFVSFDHEGMPFGLPKTSLGFELPAPEKKEKARVVRPPKPSAEPAEQLGFL